MCNAGTAVVSWGSSKVVWSRSRRRKLQRAVLPDQSWVDMSGAAGAVCAGEIARVSVQSLTTISRSLMASKFSFPLQRRRKLQQIGSVMRGMLIGLHPPRAPCHCAVLLVRFRWRRVAKASCDNITP